MRKIGLNVSNTASPAFAPCSCGASIHGRSLSRPPLTRELWRADATGWVSNRIRGTGVHHSLGRGTPAAGALVGTRSGERRPDTSGVSASCAKRDEHQSRSPRCPLIEPILGLVVATLALLGWALLGDLIAELLRPLRHLYRPPHGAYLLAVTWIAAVTGFAASFVVVQRSYWLALAMALFAPAGALMATGTYRNQRREYLGRAPVWLDPPKIGVVGRLAAGLSATVFGLTAVFAGVLAISEGNAGDAWPLWTGLGGGALVAYWLGYAAARGRFPRSAGYVE